MNIYRITINGGIVLIVSSCIESAINSAIELFQPTDGCIDSISLLGEW